VLNGNIEIAKTYIAKFLKDVLWVNLMWQKPWFDIYADPSLYTDYASAMIKAGLPELPYNVGKEREADRLLHDDLVELFSDAYREVHTTGPFGAPYKEVRSADGPISMQFAWMNGIEITGKWYIKDDQFCHRLPAIHMGREECNNVYIDREKSTESVKHLTNVYSFGLFKSKFERVEE
jgi:adenylate cyclase